MRWPLRTIAYLLVHDGLFRLLSYRTQHHCLRGGLSPYITNLKNPPWASIQPHFMKAFLNWGSLFSDGPSFCHVDVHLVKIHFFLLVFFSFFFWFISDFLYVLFSHPSCFLNEFKTLIMSNCYLTGTKKSSVYDLWLFY